MFNKKEEQRLLFRITFNSIHLSEFSDRLIGKKCYLNYIRGSNELKTKKGIIDDKGIGRFEEKIEMKTSLEYDTYKDAYKSKISNLVAVLADKKEPIAACQIDLSHFANLGVHKKKYLLTNASNEKPSIG